MRRSRIVGLALLLPLPLGPLPAAEAARQEVQVSGTVQSFGTYTVSPTLTFTLDQPGPQLLGTITVEGLYNGEYPWILRLYSDGAEATGPAGSYHSPRVGGLVSADGQSTLPLEVHGPQFGTDLWRRVPDLQETPYQPYQPSADPQDPGRYSDCILLGIDPRNAPWVAGPDGELYTGDDSPLGDWTAPTPFQILVRTRAGASAPRGTYRGVLYVELIPAP